MLASPKASARILGGMLLGLVVSAGPSNASQSAEPTPPPSAIENSQQAERVADLLRFWNFVRFFHVDPRAATPMWEAALEEAAGPALAAPDDTQLAKVAAAMLATLQPEAEVLAMQPSAPIGTASALRVETGRAVISCRGMADTLDRRGDLVWTPEVTEAIKRHGIIFDCRGFSPGYDGYLQLQRFQAWLSENAPTLIATPVAPGAIRMRFHDGYPPDEGITSGAYSSGTVDQSLPGVSATAKRNTPMVIIADAQTQNLWALVGPIHAAGRWKFLAQGDIVDPGLTRSRDKHLSMLVKTAEFVAADGRLGLRPDACIAASASDQALTIARTLLAGGKGPPCRTRSAEAPAAQPAPGTDPMAVPNLGKRMVALAKLWGTFEYFFPYKNLTDKPWSGTLEEFVPIFAGADSRAAYRDAILRLAARSQDSHVGSWNIVPSMVTGVYAPAVYIRPVQSGFAVSGLHDVTLADRLKVGDRILAVDGKPVTQISDALRDVLAASTNQSFLARAATMLAAGASGSEARLTIQRGEAAPMEVDVKRTMLFGLAGQKPKTDKPSYYRLADRTIGYVDLDRLMGDEADKAMDELMDTGAIIFDLRGYPQGSAWALAPRLALDGREGAVAAQFRRPVYTGPSNPQKNWKSFSQSIPVGDKPRYRGRVIVLIDDRAISQSEHTAMFFEAANRPLFVGAPSTGADGDVTSVALPGKLVVRFTGHDVRHADGRQLQRVGIQPDVRAAPTFPGLLAGRDEVLEAGIEAALRE